MKKPVSYTHLGLRQLCRRMAGQSEIGQGAHDGSVGTGTRRSSELGILREEREEQTRLGRHQEQREELTVRTTVVRVLRRLCRLR